MPEPGVMFSFWAQGGRICPFESLHKRQLCEAEIFCPILEIYVCLKKKKKRSSAACWLKPVFGYSANHSLTAGCGPGSLVL